MFNLFSISLRNICRVRQGYPRIRILLSKNLRILRPMIYPDGVLVEHSVEEHLQRQVGLPTDLPQVPDRYPSINIVRKGFRINYNEKY